MSEPYFGLIPLLARLLTTRFAAISVGVDSGFMRVSPVKHEVSVFIDGPAIFVEGSGEVKQN